MDIQALGAQSVRQTPQIQPTQQVPPARENQPAAPAAPDYDRYSPEEASPPAGLYRLAHDENGSPVIQFDDPEAPPQEKTEQCTINTDRVDREIEGLKKEQRQLQQRLYTAAPEQAEDLQRQLDQVERALRQKDNDGYRRQNAVIS